MEILDGKKLIIEKQWHYTMRKIFNHLKKR